MTSPTPGTPTPETPTPETSAPDLGSTVRIEGRVHVQVEQLLPRAARNDLLDRLLGAFDAAGVSGFVMKALDPLAATVGVRPGERDAALQAIGTLASPGLHLRELYPDTAGAQPLRELTAATVSAVPGRCGVLELARLWSVAGGALRYGTEQGVRVQFWTLDEHDPQLAVAPTENAAAQYVDRDLLAPATLTVDGRERPSAQVFARTLLSEVTFDIDAVYTWVDGADPAWRERMHRARAQSQGLEYHPESQADNRFLNRDELRYSLRSLEAHAPWIRRIFLVTDQQVPAWLDTSHPRVTVVDHRDIFTDPSVLPVFNSNAIISQLHHIDGLAEHYLYLNDDVFFGRDVAPSSYWFPSGIAKVFPTTLTRPFADAASSDAPHFNISKNIRTALEAELGVSISTALSHTPYPQLRSVNHEIEERFADVLRRTAGQRFRHHLDIAQDQLFHYYAQATGRAVPASQGYSYNYVNVGDARAVHRLRHLLTARSTDSFCLNDAPEAGLPPVPEHEIAAFLQAYFPVRADFELPGV